MKDKKLDLTPVIESGEPVVIVVLSQRGLEKAFVFHEEENAEALEAATQLLARVSLQLALLDSAVKNGADSEIAAVSEK